MKPEWEVRIKNWINALQEDFYEPLGTLPMEGFRTEEMLSLKEAEKHVFSPMPTGTTWGNNWEYCWMRSRIVLDERAKGERICMNINVGGEATLFVNGKTFGTRRAEWVDVPHHYICDQVLTLNGQPGETFDLVLEAYAGHDFLDSCTTMACATGPIRPEKEAAFQTPDDVERQTVGVSTYGIWHEEAYQLWLDVVTLRDSLKVLDDTSLRTAKIEEALEQFTYLVDFEQSRELRTKDYIKAREALKPVMAAHNGSSAPVMSAIGNAHLDMCWLWPYRETQRKIARTFAQQLRLMDLYPEYKFIQSQPISYQECKELYPDIYAKIKEKVKAGQWIADGSMWVEPDTNMAGGEAIIRQFVYGKRFYKEEFDVDCQLLWLPDTFGYSAVLPQILKSCGVKYLTTQKIFWTYNGSDRFPYHYFTWKGMDGTEVTSFLHMEYESRTDAATVFGRWKDRVQKRDIDKFFLPFGYGDGGGGPTRDHLEYIRREADLEGIPKVKIQAPQEFFEEMLSTGKPVNEYVGELYFQCHRGTYTSQAAIKKGNRKSELALREAEMWSVAAKDVNAYPYAELESDWKDVLLNQFHDILPGSSIAKVYKDASKKYDKVLNSLEKLTSNAVNALTDGSDNKTYFNSLSWNRRELVNTEKGYGFVSIPSCGWTSTVDYSAPANPVTVSEKDGVVVLGNGIINLKIDSLGQIVSCKDANGRERINGKANVLHMYKDVPRKFDAWDIDSMYMKSPVDLGCEASIEIEENTPFKSVVLVKRKIENSIWTQRIVLKADTCQVDFVTHVDWQERHRLLKVSFPTGIEAEEGINEIQFGYIKRPTHRSRPYDADRFEVCNHRYTAICDENKGAAVLNESKYGVSMLNDEIGLTLLRAATCPDLFADRGEHEFTYSYTFWDGSFANCNVVHQGYELNVPVLCANGFKDTNNLLDVDRDNIIVESVKLAEDGSGDIVLRLYEAKHASCSATLSLNMNPKHVYVCDMLENIETESIVKDGRVELDFRGFEIKTLRVSL